MDYTQGNPLQIRPTTHRQKSKQERRWKRRRTEEEEGEEGRKGGDSVLTDEQPGL